MLDWFLLPEGLGPQICSKGRKTCSKGMISSPLAIVVFCNVLIVRKLLIYAMLVG